MQYAEYIQSNQWKIIRKMRLKVDGYQCQTCGDNIDLEVHHKYAGPPHFKYAAILGKEKLEELITLCKICHEAITSCVRQKRYLVGNEPKLKGVITNGKNFPNKRDSTYANAQCPVIRPVKRVD